MPRVRTVPSTPHVAVNPTIKLPFGRHSIGNRKHTTVSLTISALCGGCQDLRYQVAYGQALLPIKLGFLALKLENLLPKLAIVPYIRLLLSRGCGR